MPRVVPRPGVLGECAQQLGSLFGVVTGLLTGCPQRGHFVIPVNSGRAPFYPYA
jgi:hypothetical protein